MAMLERLRFRRNRREVAVGTVWVLILFFVPLLAGYLEIGTSPGKDEIRHFAYLHSLVFDRDLDLENEYVALYDRYAARPWYVEETGLPPNPSPIGPALFWLPGYLLVVGLGLDPSGLGTASRVAAVIMSSAAVSVAVLAAYRLARRRLPYPGLSVTLVAAGSFYLYWWIWPGLYGHAVAIGVCTVYVWLWDRTRDRDEPRVWLGLGLLAGLVTIVRWQNVLLPVLSLAWRWRKSRSLGTATFGTAAFGVGFMAVASAQLAVWRVIYGSWLTMPQGSFMHWDKPYVLDTLFSPRYGLLGFSPILYVAILGLAISIWREKDALMQLALLYVPIAIYVNASAGDWYAGATFGPRRFDSLFVFLVLGTAVAIGALVRSIRRRPEIPVTAGVAVSLVGTVIMMGAYRVQDINVGMVGAHEFPARAWRAVLDTVGWPPSLPAELYHAAYSGTRIGQYSDLAHDDRLTWLDGVVRPSPVNLRGDWTIREDGVAVLQSDSGSLFLYLMDLGFHYRDIRVEIVLQARPEAQRTLRVELRDTVRINGRVIPGRLTARAHGLVYRIDVPYASWRPGINRIDFRSPGLALHRVRLSRLE